MKNKLIKLAVVAAASATLLQTVNAAPITGNIGFNGNAVLDTMSANTATEVVSWNTSTVGGDSGTFATAGVLANSAAIINAPLVFASSFAAPGMSFWTVTGTGGIMFTFNLLSSAIYSQGGGFLNVNISGTVSASGPGSSAWDTTAFSGTFSVSNPSQNGTAQFSQNLQFFPPTTTVPDGGTTVLILGASLSGLALIRRKLAA
jgi:hypothetical protein